MVELNNGEDIWGLGMGLIKGYGVTKDKDILKGVNGIEEKVRSNKDIEGVLTYLEEYDYYTFTHSVGVMSVAMGVAKELGYRGEELEDVGMGALLHDVGKTRVPKEILTKPSRLTKQEFSVIKKHPGEGACIFNSFTDMKYITDGVEKSVTQHHERLDGSGYPLGASGREIHEYAQIMAVADVFDAMTSNRVYKRAVDKGRVFKVLEEGEDRLYNSGVVSALVNCYRYGLV